MSTDGSASAGGARSGGARAGNSQAGGDQRREDSVAGIGIDLLEIDRLERALERRPRLAERLFTEGERAYAAARARPAQHLAARFCAKEAVAKALRMEVWSFQDVEVVGGDGPPEVRLHGPVAERAGELGVEVCISLTHARGEAAAVAVASVP